MRWILLVVYMQSSSAWTPPRMTEEHVFESQEECEHALGTGVFEINRGTGVAGNALIAFCRPAEGEQ